MKNLLLNFIFGASFVFSFQALPKTTTPQAKEIIFRGETQMRGASSQTTMRMTIQRPQYERELVLRTWSMGQEKAVVEILRPAKEEGVVSLRLNHNMWNYLPKTDQVVRVPASLMLQSWMGSDFTNDDLMKASSLSRDYDHKIIKVETLRGEKTLLIECLPLPQAPVVWGRILYWAREKDHLPVQQQFFDEKGKLIRTFEFMDFQTMDDRVIPTRLKITKAGTPSESTSVVYEKVLFDREVPDHLFSQNKIKDLSQKGKVASFGWFTKNIN